METVSFRIRAHICVDDVRIAQFVLKIEKLSLIIGAPVLEMECACGLHPQLWLLFQMQTFNSTELHLKKVSRMWQLALWRGRFLS